MAIGILSSIFGFLSKPLDTVLKKTLPDKAARDKFKHELEMEAMRLPFEQRKLFETRVIREIENPSLLRDAVRPIVTYCAWGLYMYIKVVTIYFISKVYLPVLIKLTEGDVNVILYKLPQIKEILSDFIRSVFTEYDFYILLAILTFWFGGKVGERIMDKITKTGGVAGIIAGLKKARIGAEDGKEIGETS